MAYQGELIRDSSDCTGNVLVQGRMAGLENRGVILPSANEEFCWVYLTHVEDGVYRDLDCIDMNVNTELARMMVNAQPTELRDATDRFCEVVRYNIAAKSQ